jgi:hypothetical protein
MVAYAKVQGHTTIFGASTSNTGGASNTQGVSTTWGTNILRNVDTNPGAYVILGASVNPIKN